ncbi:hypothetical protein [Halalkalicoccus paucihalophilus]|uniref:hypothetical protein n=1 Tax=Halalkalicoccus paucihalophilus TaxID=1008153 RepID=UPI000AE6AA5D|nr:hypothetical protein [Halalkalicoccus paucihalophilus]
MSRAGPKSAEIGDFREPENAKRFRGVPLENGREATGNECNERARRRQNTALAVIA